MGRLDQSDTMAPNLPNAESPTIVKFLILVSPIPESPTILKFLIPTPLVFRVFMGDANCLPSGDPSAR
ncbi:unnamed protein product [Spodoptera littoralis]|uniref:Uncharacterized protein n=1 Tax=Spodoptera littoralis TaxID=7109 RepID=A0A9P0N5D3_SPOLI|nr:unnamed protein product [Spodoptera littoralis]CAH1642124.1 unnamed protein product [Spodoptera littoralis]